MKNIKEVKVSLGERSYPVYIGKGLLSRVGKLFNLSRRVLVLTDRGVPKEYAEAVADACREPLTVTVKDGEGSKSLATYEEILTKMLRAGFTRGDCVVAVGGGVVGDLAGFVASSYMRGIDFYNIPTTLLSAVDASVGGKVAVNLSGIKNAVGAFYQPRGVLCDPSLLSTLPARQVSAGLAEALKMAVTLDASLFSLFENGDPIEDLEQVIAACVKIKASVVEKDEREGGLRRVLNFGHTIGHGIESRAGIEERENGLYHGECVALGMLPMSSSDVRARLLKIFNKFSLPTVSPVAPDSIFEALSHDKKAEGKFINAIFVNEIGTYEEKKIMPEELLTLAREVYL